MVAILISTRNRQAFLERQLRYYATLKSKHPIYIGDASDENEAKQIQLAIKEFGVLNIHYFWLPLAPTFDTLRHLIHQVKEPFVCLSGDDDFQVPSGLDASEKFLETHPEYVSARGRPLIFGIARTHGIFGRVYDLDYYHQPSTEQETALARVLGFFNCYYSAGFSVTRRNIFLENFEAGVGNIEKGVSCETLPGALTAAKGKSKTLHCLGFLREAHEGHVNLGSPMELLTRDDFPLTGRTIIEKVTDAVAAIDNISAESVRPQIITAYGTYLEKTLRKHRLFHSDQEKKFFKVNPAQLIRKHLKKVPLVKRAVRWRRDSIAKKIRVPSELLPWVLKYPELKPFIDLVTGHLGGR